MSPTINVRIRYWLMVSSAIDQFLSIAMALITPRSRDRPVDMTICRPPSLSHSVCAYQHRVSDALPRLCPANYNPFHGS